MTNKVYTVTDLGPGDGGKGGVVHKISCMMHARAVVKVGGAQGEHGVSTSKGESQGFSQWGCGTFEGVRTHISPRMIISPEGLLNEGNILIYRHGIHNAFDLLTVDERALCATPYHGIASRLKELARGDNPRGTVGTGVGVAYRSSQKFPELDIRARDLFRPDLKDLLAAVRDKQLRELDTIIKGEFLTNDREEANREINLLYDDGYIDYIAKRFWEVSGRVKIVDPGFLRREIFSKDGVVVVESSHGILTDHFHGFHPHASAIRTLPCFTHAMLKESGYDGQVVNIGVTRAYSIRHGAGPMPTDDPEMAEKLQPGSYNEASRYRGNVRVGPLDLVLLRYAINVCGGAKSFDGLAVTWFDQILANREWHICNHYMGADDQEFFTPNGAIKILYGTDDKQLDHQERLGKRLMSCKPEISTLSIPSDAGKDELYSFCSGILEKESGVPVRMVSFGPTEKDKICR
jgi:adenylosuccinate synthase